MNGLANEAITLIYVKEYRLLFTSLPTCQNTLSSGRVLLPCWEINNAPDLPRGPPATKPTGGDKAGEVTFQSGKYFLVTRLRF